MTEPGTTTGPSLTVAAVARRLGVAPATLRTWDRRYGLGPSEHMAGSHRRYSSSDVSRLLVMRRLTLEGVAPSEAARAALTSTEAVVAPTPGPTTTEVMDAYSDAVPMAPDPAALVSAATHFDNAAVRWMLARVHARDVIAWWSELVAPALRLLAERAVLERPGESAAPALEAAAFAELRSRAAV
ncbi:MerR family transcriptional regulator, partial [Actinotalea ferrariae]|uniref:MerR family transcriptional regulator n=1 Tax=Actinotalea ferrariae TaxID=1386098 RepID=UPI001C8CBF30